MFRARPKARPGSHTPLPFWRKQGHKRQPFLDVPCHRQCGLKGQCLLQCRCPGSAHFCPPPPEKRATFPFKRRKLHCSTKERDLTFGGEGGGGGATTGQSGTGVSQLNRLAADAAEGLMREPARQRDLDPSGGEGPRVGLSLFSPRPHTDNVSLPSPPAGCTLVPLRYHLV